ncbi:MAG TPA: hypothetical protein VKI44_28930 [Acetobacteraceae bacterium]|nr:hypothetical protein [Acetobacteraceae bacterium]
MSEASYMGSASEVLRRSQPCFLAVERSEQVTPNSLAPVSERKPPEIFRLHPSRSARLIGEGQNQINEKAGHIQLSNTEKQPQVVASRLQRTVAALALWKAYQRDRRDLEPLESVAANALRSRLQTNADHQEAGMPAPKKTFKGHCYFCLLVSRRP